MPTGQFSITVFLGGIMCLFVTSCDKWDFDRTSFTQVITVGALEVGFNSAFLLGDIEGLKNARVTETGFVFSSTADNEQSLRLDQDGVEVVLSPRHQDSIISEERAFAARATGLAASTKYYFRALITLEEGEVAYGAIDTLTTVDLTVSAPNLAKNFTDCEGNVTITVNILGAFPAPDNSFGIVWSSDEGNFDPVLGSANQLDVEAIDAQGNVTVELPVECNAVYFVRGFYSTREVDIYGPVQAFTTTGGGIWILVGTFPEQLNPSRCVHSFYNDEAGFVFTSDAIQEQNRLWRYDPQEQIWQAAAQPPFQHFCAQPPARTVESAFFSGSEFNLWEYDMGADLWFNWSMAVNDRVRHFASFIFFHDNVSYWGTGHRSFEEVFDDTWWSSFTSSMVNAMPDFPGGPRHSTSFFILENCGYVGLGQDLEGQFFQDFWRLDFNTFSWSQIESLSDQIRPSLDFTMNDKAYLLTGYDANDTPLSNFYEYDSTLDQWTRLTDFGEGGATADVGFAIDDIIYGGLGISKDGERSQEIWRYVPEVD